MKTNMKVEIAENDAYLHEDGQPRIFIFRVNGKPFPCPAEVSIGEFWRRVEAQACFPKEDYADSIHVSTIVEDHGHQLGTKQNTSKKIEEGDIVQCTKVPTDLDGNAINSDLEVGKSYIVQRIIAINGKRMGYEVVDANGDWPQRLKLGITDVSLLEKGKKTVKVETPPSVIKSCPECKEPNNLVLQGDFYKANCTAKDKDGNVCGKEIIESRNRDAQPVVA